MGCILAATTVAGKIAKLLVIERFEDDAAELGRKHERASKARQRSTSGMVTLTQKKLCNIRKPWMSGELDETKK
jgi:hypothetical protein